MNRLLPILLAATTLAEAAGGADRFLLATFNNGEQQLRVLHSTNAADFNGYASGIAYTPPPGSNLRDPSIISHRGRYYICHTAGNFGAVDHFSVLVSDDLASWTHLADVSMAALGNVRWTWAPEWFLDDDGSLHVLVSASQTERITVKHTIYELHPRDASDLTQWSDPVPVEGPDAFPPWTDEEIFVGTYDPYVVKRGSTYWMFFFNVRSSCIELARSTNTLTGPYHPVRTGNWQGIGAYKEGPTVMYLGGGRWRMIFADAIYSYVSYTDSTNNWTTWTTPQRVGLPGAPTNFTVNHGTLLLPPGGWDAGLEIARSGPNPAQVSFLATGQDRYQVLSGTNLSTWTTEGVVVPAAGRHTVAPASAEEAGQRFWRIVRLLPE